MSGTSTLFARERLRTELDAAAGGRSLVYAAGGTEVVAGVGMIGVTNDGAGFVNNTNTGLFCTSPGGVTKLGCIHLE